MGRAIMVVAVVLSICLLVAVVYQPQIQANTEVKGTLMNDDDPYIVEGDDGEIYKCEWFGGDSSCWSEDDRVLLTKTYGMGYMIGLSGASKGHKAKVWIEEEDE
jgi:hypothetical protein